jgi:ABC-2 type transport system permease protein
MTATIDRRSNTRRARAGVRLVASRVLLELRVFGRVREEVGFTFTLPIILLVLFATIFGGEIRDTGVDFSQYFVAGMLASTGITVGFQSLAAQLAVEQHDGTVKRLAGTSMPATAYLFGKLGVVVIVAVVQAVLMFTIGVAAFDVTLPTGTSWLLFGSIFVLNLAVFSLLGIGISGLISSPRAASAVTALPALVLQFVSGVYVFAGDLPDWLRTISSVFPLYWSALGLRQALLPDSFSFVEAGQSWRTGMMYLMLFVWLGVGAALARRGVRWRLRE